MLKSVEKYDDICELKHKILSYVGREVSEGMESDPAKVHVLGEYVDMIKDLAEAEKYCQESCYYESIIDAMDEYDEIDRMGYRKRNSRGRFVSSNSNYGNNAGYNPDVYSRMMMDKMIDDKMMNSKNDYDMEDDTEHRYGRSFDKYRKAKRHYTQTHSETDKEKMKEHAREHMNDTLSTLREIWENADPELRVKMKSDVTGLMNSMTN